MKWQATVVAIATVVAGCDDLEPCPGSGVCGVGDNIFTNNRCNCDCQASQRTDPEHMCCDSAEGCTPASGTPDPGSGMTPNATFPILSVQSLNAVVTASGQFDIRACEGFTASFIYVNRANGELLSPLGYGLPPPTLTITEVGIGSAIVPNPREVPWETGLAPGAVAPKSEAYGDGINPNNSSLSTTVAVAVEFLPQTTSGVLAIAKDIGRFGEICM